MNRGGTWVIRGGVGGNRGGVEVNSGGVGGSRGGVGGGVARGSRVLGAGAGAGAACRARACVPGAPAACARGPGGRARWAHSECHRASTAPPGTHATRHLVSHYITRVFLKIGRHFNDL